MICRTFPLGTLRNYKYVVILSFYNGRIMLSRHRNRLTWETQGGHIESGETPLTAAHRELYEESGATGYHINPVFDYWVMDESDGSSASGQVFMASVTILDKIPESEMSEVSFFDSLPNDLTYPEITPVLFSELLTMEECK